MKNATYLISKINHKKDIWEIEMTPEHKPINYQSGQFIFVRFYNEKLSKEAHPFSIASKSNSKNIKLMVKSLGDFTTRLENLRIKDKVSIEGPYGRFNFRNQKNHNQIWIAAGIGIAPFLGMVEELENSPDFKVDLYHTAKDQSELIGYNFLKLFSSKLKNFRYIPWSSGGNKRRIDTKEISRLSGDLMEKDFFLCGPENFKEDMIEQLVNVGIKKSHVHEEVFNFR
jgi:predicted ferric reductase